MAEPQVSLASDSRQCPVENGETRHSKISWTWHLLNFSPFSLLVWFVSRFGVNVPIMDDWWLTDLFHAVGLKKAAFDDFFALNNEHRIVFPKLIWTLLAFTTHWNLKVEMMLNLILGLIVFLVFYRIALRQAKQSGGALFNPANFATSLLLFSLMQYENWLWGFGGAFFLVQASVALAIGVCFEEKLQPWVRFGLAAFFCFIASFSSAQGLFSWLALLPCIAQLQAETRKVSKFYIWFLLFAASVALYSYHFKFALWAGDTTSDFLSHPLRSAGFFMALLGAPFCQGNAALPASTACLVGGAILLALLGCLVFLRGYERKDTIAPWLSVALFGLLFTAMVTAARSGFGLGLAVNVSRYVTGTIFVPIAAVQLGRMVWVRRGPQFYIFLVGALCSLALFGSISSISVARHLKEERSQAKLFLDLIRYIDPATDSSKESRLFPVFAMEGYTGYIRTPAEFLNDLDFLHLASGVTFVDHPSPDKGSLESADGSGDLSHLRSKDEVTVSGWASPPEVRGVPKLILISYGNQRTFITGAVVGGVARPDLAALRRDPRYLHSGWTVSFPAKFLPPGEGILKAWVYDSTEKKFTRLAESGGEKQFKVETQ